MDTLTQVEKKQKMSGWERFGIVTGIIGLIADSIALTTFVTGLWNPSIADSNQSAQDVPFIINLLMGVGIVYGWISVSWYLIRRRFIMRRNRTEEGLPAIFLRTVTGVGILVAPLIFGWWAVVIKDDAAQQQIAIQQRQVIRATQTSEATRNQTTPELHSSATPTPNAIGASQEKDHVDTSMYVLTIPFVTVGLWFGVFWLLILLMPVVYGDMPDISVQEVLNDWAARFS